MKNNSYLYIFASFPSDTCPIDDTLTADDLIAPDKIDAPNTETEVSAINHVENCSARGRMQ